MARSFDCWPDRLPPHATVRWTEIKRLQTRGNSAGKGAWVGAIVGAGLGLAVGIAAQSDPWLAGNHEGVMAGVAGSALFGAGVGALIGVAVPKWVDVHVGRAER